MDNVFSEEKYDKMIADLFRRFPSYQKTGAGAYKPGIANMEFFDSLAGHPHRKYDIIHVAGTNGKGSVSNMLASVLSSCGLRTGLYTSPHILDFRERMRIRDGNGEVRLISRQEVWDFVQKWSETFDHLDLSFFEITTMMAFCWFAECGVDIAVIETGLGGRLDSTNIVSPVLSVITNIGLDHCDMLGATLPEIAFEKAGIIKPGVPVAVGESDADTDSVFERKVLYSNISDPKFMGDRSRIMSHLVFADKYEPSLWGLSGEILERMDLQGVYQSRNLRTVLAAVEMLKKEWMPSSPERAALLADDDAVADAIAHTAARMDFHGRWEKLSDDPYIICDIGHNVHGLKYNFAQLEAMRSEGRISDLIIVYGSVADKDVASVLDILPENAEYVFTSASGSRAMGAEEIRSMYIGLCSRKGLGTSGVHCCGTVVEAMRTARGLAAGIKAADPCARPLIYIGGSTYVVSEAVAANLSEA